MRFEIDIKYPKSEMDKSLKRLIARSDFRYEDRAPVNFCIEPRLIAPYFGIKYKDIFTDAETQYYYLLKFAKWQIENIPSDFCHAPFVAVAPYFDNVKQASAFGCRVEWSENAPLQAVPFMKDVAEIDNMYLPKPTDGLFGQYIDWWFKFQEFAKDTKVTFSGGETGKVILHPLTVAGLSPHMVATDIAGTELFYWMGEEPEMCHKMLDKITRNQIECEEYVRKLSGVKIGGFGLAEDSATMLSPQMYREIAMPYSMRMYEHFGKGLKFGRGMHNCGSSTHLLDVFVDEVKISDYNVFGYLVKPETAAEKLGGKMLLWGNINPMLMLSGTKAQVKDECLRALSNMAPCGGFMLGDGANVCPGTPLENITVFCEAAAEYGKPKVKKKYAERTLERFGTVK